MTALGLGGFLFGLAARGTPQGTDARLGGPRIEGPLKEDRTFPGREPGVLTVQMDLETGAGRVVPGACGAWKHLRSAFEASAFATEHVARHRRRPIARPTEVPALTSVLRGEEVMAGPKMAAPAARQKAKVSALVVTVQGT